jgi:hypothetical protein
VYLDSNEVPKRKNDFEIAESDAFATPGSASLERLAVLTAESGFNVDEITSFNLEP